jgi:hypothetical protein
MLLKLDILGRKLSSHFYGVVLFSLFFQGSWALAAPKQLRPQIGLANPPALPTEVAKLKVQQTIRLKREDLKVQLTQCVREGKGVVCTILLSSNKEKVPVWVTDPNRRRSRLIDTEGNEYSSFAIVQFGKSEANLLFIDKTPIKLVLRFDDLPDQLANIALLEIGFETYGHEVPVQFHKVNVLNLSIAEQTETPDANAEQALEPEECWLRTSGNQRKTCG